MYDRHHCAVNGLSFSVAEGEFVALLGASGCGKTTTLRMIAGLESVTSGSILIDHQVVNQIPSKDRDVAMVFQNYALYPHLTVHDNMALGLKFRKYSNAEIRKRIGWAAELLQITEILDRKPKRLSGGQQQRVAVGRAIVCKPKVFLFDEPLSNLDTKLRAQMRTELARLHQELKTTTIYVTHDQTEAMTLADRVIVMNEGTIQQISDPGSIYHRPQNRFVAEFIGNPGMNFIRGFIEIADGACTFVSDQRELCIRIATHSHRMEQSHPVVLGFRPEHIQPVERAASRDPEGWMQAEVVFEEHLGPESYVYGKTLSTTFMARVAGSPNFRIKKQYWFELDPRRIHLFDAETGDLILHGGD